MVTRREFVTTKAGLVVYYLRREKLPVVKTQAEEEWQI
jgi:hypothetical protein